MNIFISRLFGRRSGFRLKIMFATSLIMLMGTEADVIVVELGFTFPQHFSGHMECSGLS